MTTRQIALLGVLAAALAGCSHQPAPLSFGPEYGLHFNDQGETVALGYGLADSDEVQLFLQCPKGSGRVLVSDVDRGQPATALVLSSDGRRTSVPVKLDASEGVPEGTMAGETPLANPALTAFRRTGVLEVSLGGRAYRITASPAEREGVERFFRACGRG